MQKKYGLIGSTLSHSFSKEYFDEKFFRDKLHDCHYSLYTIQHLEEVEELLTKTPDLCGLNVTFPYKELILKLLHKVDPYAQQIGSVNVIKIQDGIRTGYNTDSYAFQKSISSWYKKTASSQALIFGTGGSSKSVQFALRKMEILFKTVSQHKKQESITYDELKKQNHLFASCNLIINTTPLGMFPNTHKQVPINFDCLTPKHFVYDLIYNPARTRFLQRAEMRGSTIKNGLEMLQIQAEKAWHIWTSKTMV